MINHRTTKCLRERINQCDEITKKKIYKKFGVDSAKDLEDENVLDSEHLKEMKHETLVDVTKMIVCDENNKGEWTTYMERLSFLITEIFGADEFDNIFKYWESKDPLICDLIREINIILGCDIKETTLPDYKEYWIIGVLITKVVTKYSLVRPHPHLKKWPTIACVNYFFHHKFFYCDYSKNKHPNNSFVRKYLPEFPKCNSLIK